MPSTAATNSDVPTVPLSFSNNFWGRDDAGVAPLLDRMQNAKTTCDELKAFYNARAALEDDYSRKLLALCRKPLGSAETGTLRVSLDVLRGELETTGKSHATIAHQMKTELEEPLAAFAGGMKERRKIVQAGIERLLLTKRKQIAQVNKARDRFEQDCLRIKGYLAQGHMVMGQEERKNKSKLEKTQINMATDSNDYEAAVKVLQETTGRWNKEWKAACDKFQDLEEERLDFTKSSLWSFANIASTVCVSDDASCEKIRLALEECEVEKDIVSFIKEQGTGQEIPDPPRYINFCRGDMADTASEASEDENYSVAQFPRTVNPAFRSASPNPSTYESHHDPHSQLAQEMGHGQSSHPPRANDRDITPLKTNSGRPAPLNYRQQEQNVPPNYSPSQHGDVATVPHNEYPTEGMTMFCRTGPPSVTGSGLSTNTRPSSRDSQSDYSNPTSHTSADPVSGKPSPTKGMPPVNGVQMPGMSDASPDKSVQKRPGFFSNSPFRRKSKKDLNQPTYTPTTDRGQRNTWAPQSAFRINTGPIANASPTKTISTNAVSTHSSPTKSFGRNNTFSRNQPPDGEEQADPRATFQLNVGNNVFDVASPDSQTTPKARKQIPAPNLASDDMAMDPLKQALMDLQQGGGGMNKQSSTRVTADRYHGITTPAPDAAAGPTAPLSAAGLDNLAAKTPPPAYDGVEGETAPVLGVPAPAPALGVPEPAFTSKEMRKRTQTWGQGNNGIRATYTSGRNSQGSRAGTRDDDMPRSRSPGPEIAGMTKAASPQPLRARSPDPPRNADMGARSPGYQVNANEGARSPAHPVNQQVEARSPAGLVNQHVSARNSAPPVSHDVRARNPAPSMRARSPAPPTNQVRARSPAPPMNQMRSRSPAPLNQVRARSPAPPMNQMRSRSPAPLNQVRARSPAPPMNQVRAKSPAPVNRDVRARNPAPSMKPAIGARSPVHQIVTSWDHYPTATPDAYGYHHRTASPNAYGDDGQSQSRQNSEGMEMQLSTQDVQRYDAGNTGRGRHSVMDRRSRPGSAYGVDLYGQGQGGRGNDPQMRRERSDSVALIPSVSGNSVLHYARAMYHYSAAILEEQSFSKGDRLAVLRKQDDGWWEAEVLGTQDDEWWEAQMKRGRKPPVGLVPSNYLQPI